MAEFIMKNLIKNNEFNIYVESAATSNEEIGNTIYPDAKNILRKHNIPFTDREARRVTKEDYDSFDILVVMDEENLYCLERSEKIHKLLEFAGSDEDIEDPWYTRNFEKVYKQIESGCMGLLEYIKKLKKDNTTNA